MSKIGIVLSVLVIATTSLLVQSWPVNHHQRSAPLVKHNRFNSKRDQQPSGPPVFLLISTSSKLYSMRIPDPLTAVGPAPPTSSRHHHANYYQQPYEVIYEEKTHTNNWITDAFYVKSENLIYVNVYNSTSATSDIFTLRYDTNKNQWVKSMLYEDQAYCLGIAYNEERRELYWTAAKSVLSGPSHVVAAGEESAVGSREFKTLFNLDLAKKVR